MNKEKNQSQEKAKQPSLVKNTDNLNRSIHKEKISTTKDQSHSKNQPKDKSPQKLKGNANIKPNPSLDKSIDLSPSKAKLDRSKDANSIPNAEKQIGKKKSQNQPIQQNPKTKPQQKNTTKQQPKKILNNIKDLKDSPSKLSKSISQAALQSLSVPKDIKGKSTNAKEQPKTVNKDKKIQVLKQKQIPPKKQTKTKNPSKSLIVQSPSKNPDKNNKNSIMKALESPAKLETKQSPQKVISKQSPIKDAKSGKNEQLAKSPNKDSKNSILPQNQSLLKKELNKKVTENLLKQNGAKINISSKNSNGNQSSQKNENNKSLSKDPKGKGSKNVPIPQRVVESAPQSPRIVQSKYSPEDIERIKFLKRLQKEKKLIEQRLKQQKQLQEMEQERIHHEKQRQEQRQHSKQKANKLRNIEARLEQIERRKEERKRQISERNRQYLQKKTQFTLEHKIINQWLEKQMEENKIKEKQLEAKVSRMKPINNIQAIKDHIQLIQSYKQMHSSRFNEQDIKFQRSKSRIQLQKMYKSNWYKKILENDPTETFKLEEEKKKQQKQLLLMQIDNMKKYAEYVKANHKPDNTQQSVFRYQRPIIKHLTADQIKRMGIDNLSYCKEIIEKNPKQNSKPSLSQHNEPPKYQDYLQKLKTQRQKKQNLGSQKDFDQLVQKIKNSTSLTKDQKVKRITQLAEKMQTKARQKQDMFNRTNSSRLKILQNKIKDSRLHKRQQSLPFLKQRSASQPKLKITDSNKILLKDKDKTNNDEFLKQMDQKLMLLKKI